MSANPATDQRADASEYTATRTGAGYLDRSDLGLLEVTGKDRATFLHAMLTNDVKSLRPGEGCSAALLDVHGKVQMFATVWALDDRVLVLTPPGLAAKLAETLDTFLFAEKAYLRDASGEMAFVLLAGPATASLVAQLTGTTLPERAWQHTAARLGEVDVRIVRGAGESGEVEAWIASAASDGPAVREALRAAGAATIGPAAWESLRVEAGTPAFGFDADPTVLLPEVPFSDRVSYTKGCYLGQEVVVRIRDRGHVNRLLAGLALEGSAVPPRDARVFAGKTEIGRVTSATWSFGLSRPIALAFVRRSHAAPDTGLTVALADDRRVSATVSALPFTR